MTEADGANTAKWLNQYLLQSSPSFHSHARETTEEKKNSISPDSVLSKFYGFYYAHSSSGSEQVGVVPEIGTVGLRQRLCIFCMN